MNNRAQFSGMLRATADETNHTQTIIDFIFTDFAPNLNGMGVGKSESANIIRTGLNAPVKVDFLGDDVSGHDNAIPIGPIIELSEVEDKIIGKAVIWKSEFPAFVDYLKTASASEGGVQFSWELFYKSAEKDESGVQWLQDCIVAGIAIVADPAYSGRTHLLSYAADTAALHKRIKSLEEKVAELSSLDRSLVMDPTIEGLQAQVQSLTDQLYSMVSQLWEALDSATPAPSAPDVEALAQSYVDLISRLKDMRSTSSVEQTELTELREYKASIEKEKARSELLTSRSQTLSTLMSLEDISAKAEFILNLSDEQFTEFVNSLQVVSNKAQSSKLGRISIPDAVVSQSSNAQSVTVRDLAGAFLKARAQS